MAVTKKIILTLFLLVITLQNAFAEMMQKGKTKFKFLLNLYHQNSDGGHQVFDNSKREEVNVAEPMLFIEHQITENTALNAHFVFDFWTAASDTKLDAQTGASGGEAIKGQSRTSGKLGVRHEISTWTLSASGGFSSEYDYRSFNGSVGVEKRMAKDNFTLGTNLQYYYDGVKLFEDLTPANTATISEFKDRKIMALDVSASQILTPKDIIQFGTTFVQAKGYLESTASTTLVNGTREVEDLPERRSRYALSSKWVHGLNDFSALNLSYRYYFDQWDLNAHTLRAAYLLEFNEEEDMLEFAVRFHDQSKVEYFAESFSSSTTHRTSDSDLDAFNSYEFSVFLSKALKDRKLFSFSLEGMKWNNGVTYYTRDNGLKYAYLQSSIGFEF